MTEIGINLRVLFGKSGELREAFRLTVTLPADKPRADLIIHQLRLAVTRVLDYYVSEVSDHVDLRLTRTREEVT